MRDANVTECKQDLLSQKQIPGRIYFAVSEAYLFFECLYIFTVYFFSNPIKNWSLKSNIFGILGQYLKIQSFKKTLKKEKNGEVNRVKQPQSSR